MAVVSAQFAFALVEVRGIGERWRKRLFVCVAWGVRLSGRNAVILVLILDGRGSARTQGLTFRELIPKFCHSFLLLYEKSYFRRLLITILSSFTVMKFWAAPHTKSAGASC